MTAYMWLPFMKRLILKNLRNVENTSIKGNVLSIRKIMNWHVQTAEKFSVPFAFQQRSNLAAV